MEASRPEAVIKVGGNRGRIPLTPKLNIAPVTLPTFRDVLRALVAKGLATWFNDPFSVQVAAFGNTSLNMSVSPEQTVLITEMRAYNQINNVISFTMQCEGYTFWDDPAMQAVLYASPIDFVEQLVYFPSTRQINITLANSAEVPCNVTFLFFGLTMDTNIWDSVRDTYFSGVIEDATSEA